MKPLSLQYYISHYPITWLQSMAWLFSHYKSNHTRVDFLKDCFNSNWLHLSVQEGVIQRRCNTGFINGFYFHLHCIAINMFNDNYKY